MFLLVTYVTVAIAFSFLCSILEAVLLSVNSAYIALLEKKGKPSGRLLRKLKNDVGKPLAAILTLNTIAHTIGAAGAGAEAAAIFGSNYVGVISAVLTLLILVFSEIIPKTLGAHFWRQLAPSSAFILKYMVIILYPFVKMAELLTNRFTSKPTLSGLSREEFAAMAELSSKHGQLEELESRFLKNLMLLRKTLVKDAMTPRTVMFSLSQEVLVEEFFHKHDQTPFSRIPIFEGEREDITGYVFRSDLLLAQARGNGNRPLKDYRHNIPGLLDTMPLSQALKELSRTRANILLVINEYASIQGIITMEDVIETILGLEIVDEKDKAVDMQKEARRKWKKRAKKKGIDMSKPFG